jgi:hypothetical protein
LKLIFWGVEVQGVKSAPLKKSWLEHCAPGIWMIIKSFTIT